MAINLSGQNAVFFAHIYTKPLFLVIFKAKFNIQWTQMVYFSEKEPKYHFLTLENWILVQNTFENTWDRLVPHGVQSVKISYKHDSSIDTPLKIACATWSSS